MGQIDGLRMDPFLIGMFCGKKKNPPDELLKEFFQEVRELERAGVQIGGNGNWVPIAILNFICDTPARSYIKNVRYLNHNHGCQDCNQVCTGAGRSAIFSIEFSELRTNDSFNNRTCIEHH